MCCSEQVNRNALRMYVVFKIVDIDDNGVPNAISMVFVVAVTVVACQQTISTFTAIHQTLRQLDRYRRLTKYAARLLLYTLGLI